jgi:acyl-CoA synthetase (AMP-forming)/AMP-acid ligase II
MTLTELLNELAKKGVQISVVENELKVHAPKGVLSEELIRELSKNKAGILSAFRHTQGDRVHKADRQGPLPLSDVQEELWLVEQLYAGLVSRNVTAAFRLAGKLDVDILRQTVVDLTARHEILRTSFRLQDGSVIQWISPDPIVDFDIVNEVPESGNFDLSRAPLFRTSLLRVSEAEYILYLTAHHLIFDVESVWLFVRELAQVYGALVEGKPMPLDELFVQYADFAIWQRKRSHESLAYWGSQLQAAPAALVLPTDRPRQPVRDFRPSRQSLIVPQEVVERLAAVSRQETVTRFVTLLAALDMLLARYSGQGDIIVGSPVSGRNHPDAQSLIGSFAYPLALRVNLSGNPSFRELLGRVRETTIGALEHQDVPFARILESVKPARRPGYSPLFQVLFTHPPAQGCIELPGLAIHPIHDLLQGVSEYDLVVSVVEGSDGLRVALTYSEDLFNAKTIERMLHNFVNILAEVAENPDMRLSSLQVLGTAEFESRREKRLEVPRVEAALRKFPSVADAAVLVRSAGLNAELIGYIVPSGQVVPDELHAHMKRLLPVHLLPSAYVPVSHLPLTAEGVVDADLLSGIPVIDQALIESVETQLDAHAGIGQAAVLPLENVNPIPPIHLSELLSDWKVASPPIVDAREALEDPPASITESEGRRMAFSDGGPLVFPAEAPQTLTDAFLRTAAGNGNNGVVYVAADGTRSRQTHAALRDDALRVLGGLQAGGFRPGDRVILQVSGLPDHFVTFWACVLGGIVPITVAIPISYEANNAVVGKLYNTWKLLDRPAILSSRNLQSSISGLTELMGMEGLRVLAVEALRDAAATGHVHAARPEDLVFFQLTSGSTGIPKCIQETHRGIVAHIHGIQQHNGHNSQDITLNWLPLDHVLPILGYHLKNVYLGCEEVQVKTELILDTPERWLELIEEFKVTHSWAPNFGFKLVTDRLKQGLKRQLDLSSVKCFTNAGEQVTMPVVADFLQAVSPFGIQPRTMQPGYGMAETCTVMASANDFDLAKGTCRFMDLGPPIPGVQIRITNSDNQIVPEGVIGRLQVKGDVITPGYLNNDEANRAAFLGDGWFNTGDVGYILNGRLSLTGREKEMIIVRGANFYCYEIEDVINTIEGVEPTFSAACAIPDSETGSEGLAIFFVRRAGTDCSTATTIQAIRSTVGRSLGLSPSLVIPLAKSEFPKTTSGKIQRSHLRKLLAEGHFDAVLKDIDLELGNANTLPDWFYKRSWRQRDLIPRPFESKGLKVLMFMDSGGLSELLYAQLTERGAHCVRVVADSHFQRTVSEFRINPDDISNYRRLFEALAEDGFQIEQIIHLWTIEWQSPEEWSLQKAALRLLFLIRALNPLHERAAEIDLLVVSSGTQAALSSDELRMEHGSLPGLLKTIPREMPWLHVRHVDLPAGADQTVSHSVLQELQAGDNEIEIAYRKNKRLVCRLEPANLRHSVKRELPFRSRGTYLLSGGLGGIGVEIARYLLQHHECNLLLVGTTARGALSVERLESLNALERLSGNVRYAALDICDVPRLQTAVQDACLAWREPLDGVIHLAGILKENALFEETSDSFAASLWAKVQGTITLHELVRSQPGALFIHFSSVNACFGGFRVGAYSAANAFADRFAHYQRQCGLQSYNLMWSMWDEVGMSRGYPSKALSRSRGYYALSPKQGLQSFLAGLHQPPSELLIGLDATKSDIRRQQDGKPYGLLSLRAFFTSDSGVPPALPQLMDRFGAPVLCELKHVAEIPADKVQLAGCDEKSAATTSSAPMTEMEKKIARVWKDMLKVREVGVNENFFDLGGHSVLLLQMHRRLVEAAGWEFPLVDLVRYPKISDLAAYLNRKDKGQTSTLVGQSRAERRRKAIVRTASPSPFSNDIVDGRT